MLLGKKCLWQAVVNVDIPLFYIYTFKTRQSYLIPNSCIGAFLRKMKILLLGKCPLEIIVGQWSFEVVAAFLHFLAYVSGQYFVNSSTTNPLSFIPYLHMQGS